MKLVIYESYPGEITCGCAKDVHESLEKAVRTVRRSIKKTLPSLPGDGEVKAVRQLSEILEEEWASHAKGLVNLVLEQVDEK